MDKWAIPGDFSSWLHVELVACCTVCIAVDYLQHKHLSCKFLDMLRSVYNLHWGLNMQGMRRVGRHFHIFIYVEAGFSVFILVGTIA